MNYNTLEPMRFAKIILSTFVATALLAAGCDSGLVIIPRNIAQYDLMQKNTPGAYPDSVILMHNLLRASDKDLPAAQRVEAIQLVNKIGPDDARSRQGSLELLSDPSTPAELRSATLEIVLAKEDPTWAAPLVALMPKLKSNDP